ncbi:DNA-binding transcriptional ArsR family regulator [Crossiella equi]|uniref:DNA-binding transcriptional ArsR family regulator n=1 Tax=Crossiella equi TaxID=130796 RepID=A0ABS5AJE1_9PSEU|nr:winged helix-turn-helix domain-containing protein [Crossiella equi]MBP2476692.1 DNA-binding transcriptional ArsR family regulator [Crossiella equi]
MLDIVPPYGYCPDFLTPAASATEIDEGIDALLDTPEHELRTDLAEFAGSHPTPLWFRRVGEGDKRALRSLTSAVHSYFKACVAPHWKLVRRTVARDRVRRADTVRAGGTDLLLSTLHPSVRWRNPVLEVDFPVDQDLHLDGRGLRLVPSFFCNGMPTTYKDPTRPPVLVYSITHYDPLTAKGTEDSPVLSALLGETRARMLAAVADAECNTSELARRTGAALASASQHATVLRNAGLIWSRKSGRSVVHVATDLGRALLAGASEPS